MIFQGKDGVIRLTEHGNNATTYQLDILFCEMDFTGPTSRPRTEETMRLNRGNFTTDTHFVEGPDDVRIAPIPISFSCRVADTENTRVVLDWLSGVTMISGTTQIYSRKGKSTIDGITLPTFYDSTGKYAYRLEVLWDTSGSDHGFQYEEVYFPPGEQSIAESADGVMLNCSGMVYGDVTRIVALSTNTSII